MRVQNLEKLIHCSFKAEEMALLMMDATFRKALNEARDLDDFEAVANYGANLLAQAQFPQKRPNRKSDAQQSPPRA